MTFSTRNFDLLTPLAPKFPNFATQILLYAWNTLLPSSHMHMCYKIFTPLKTTFRTKIGGSWARGASKKFGTPYIFLQPLKLATSNLVHNLVSGLAYQKPTIWTNIGGGLGQGSIRKKMWDPLRIFATVKANNFKFGKKIGFGTSLPKSNVLDKNWRGSGPREHPNKIWDPLLISATVEASNFKFGTQHGLGTSLPKTTYFCNRWS